MAKLDIGNSRTDVLAFIVGCDSMVKFTTGSTNNNSGTINKNVIVVHEACPRVVREIVQGFNLVSLQSDGLHIPLNKED